MNLLCPVCGEQLNKMDRQYRCSRNHSFDVARQGYVNLLVVQQKHSLNPGDTREQVLCRREFLEGGFYRPLLDALTSLEEKYRLPLQLRYVEGYSVAEVAQMLRLPQGTVKSRLSRGRDRLRAMVKEEVFE